MRLKAPTAKRAPKAVRLLRIRAREEMLQITLRKNITHDHAEVSQFSQSHNDRFGLHTDEQCDRDPPESDSHGGRLDHSVQQTIAPIRMSYQDKSGTRYRLP